MSTATTKRKDKAEASEQPEQAVAVAQPDHGAPLDVEALRRELKEHIAAEMAAAEQRLEQKFKQNSKEPARPQPLEREDIATILAADPRATFQVLAPARVGAVTLQAGQLISNATHNIGDLARAGAALTVPNC